MSLSLTYYGHSCFLIKGEEGTVIIDPFLDENPAAPVGADEIVCDAVVVTHGHHDHLGDAIKIAERNDVLVVATYELANFVQEHGVETHPMHIGGSQKFPFGEVKLFPAFHGGLVAGDRGKFTCQPCGIIYRCGGVSVYHAGDTALTAEMELLARFDRIDVALLPIGDNFTMGPQDAAHAVELIRPRTVIPMHYNTFPVVAQDPAAFKQMVEEKTKAECVILAPGQTHTIA